MEVQDLQAVTPEDNIVERWLLGFNYIDITGDYPGGISLILTGQTIKNSIATNMWLLNVLTEKIHGNDPDVPHETVLRELCQLAEPMFKHPSRACLLADLLVVSSAKGIPLTEQEISRRLRQVDPKALAVAATESIVFVCEILSNIHEKTLAYVLNDMLTDRTLSFHFGSKAGPKQNSQEP